MNFDKSFGYFLLIIGLGIIVFSIYHSSNIFLAKSEPPKVFEDQPENALENLEVDIQETISKLLPQGSLSKLANLIAWSIFAGIMIFGGGKIGSLGINLISKSKEVKLEKNIS